MVENDQNLTLRVPPGANMTLCKSGVQSLSGAVFCGRGRTRTVGVVDGVNVQVLDLAMGHRLRRYGAEQRHDVVHASQSHQQQRSFPLGPWREF